MAIRTASSYSIVIPLEQGLIGEKRRLRWMENKKAPHRLVAMRG